MLAVIQIRRKEYLDACDYVQSTLKKPDRLAALIPEAENLSKLEKKLRGGNDLTPEEVKSVKTLTGELLFGFTEQ